MLQSSSEVNVGKYISTMEHMSSQLYIVNNSYMATNSCNYGYITHVLVELKTPK